MVDDDTVPKREAPRDEHARSPETAAPEMGGTRAKSRGTSTIAESTAFTVMHATVRNRRADADLSDLVEKAAANLVRGAGDVDNALADTAKGAIAGAIEAGRELGRDEHEMAEAAALGALEAAGDFGPGAVEHIKSLVTGPIRGIKPLDESTFAKGDRTP
jgi:hypothetical protein